MLYPLAMLFMLAACAGHEKGTDAGWGLGFFDTTTKADKENNQWFNSFYGKNHCYGQWASDCTTDDAGGGGGGGMWGGGIGPSDAGSTSTSD